LGMFHCQRFTADVSSTSIFASVVFTDTLRAGGVATRSCHRNVTGLSSRCHISGASSC